MQQLADVAVCKNISLQQILQRHAMGLPCYQLLCHAELLAIYPLNYYKGPFSLHVAALTRPLLLHMLS